MSERPKRRLFDESPTEVAGPGTPDERQPRRRLFDESPEAASQSGPAPRVVVHQAARPAHHEGGVRPTRAAPQIAAALELAKKEYGDLVARNEARFKRKLEQLIGWDLEVIRQWGIETAAKQGDLATRAADHVRDFSALNAGEKLERVLQEVLQPLGRLEKLFGVERNIDARKLELEGTQGALTRLQPLTEELAAEQGPVADELLLLVGALSVAVTVFGVPQGASEEQALDQRRRSLQMSLQQAQKLKETLDNMLGMIVRLCGDFSHALNVTLTNAKLAQLQSR